MLTEKQVVDAIKRYNLKVQPCLAKKELENDENYWAAGMMAVDKTYHTNYVKFITLAFGKTLEEAVEKSILKIHDSTKP